jgi:glutamate dehydrogenase
MIAYTKNADVAEMLKTDLPDDPVLDGDLSATSRAAARPVPDQIRSHRLRREIVATQVVNQMVNLSGISYDHRMTEDTGASVTDVVRAWVAAREILDFPSLVGRDRRARGDRPRRPSSSCSSTAGARPSGARCGSCATGARRSTIGRDGRRTSASRSALEPWLHGCLRGPMADASTHGRGRTRGRASPTRWPTARRCGRCCTPASTSSRSPIAPRSSRSPRSPALLGAVRPARADVAVGRDRRAPAGDRWQTQARSALRDDLLTALAELTGNDHARQADGSVEVVVAANERSSSARSRMALFTEIRRSDQLRPHQPVGRAAPAPQPRPHVGPPRA